MKRTILVSFKNYKIFRDDSLFICLYDESISKFGGCDPLVCTRDKNPWQSYDLPDDVTIEEVDRHFLGSRYLDHITYMILGEYSPPSSFPVSIPM